MKNLLKLISFTLLKFFIFLNLNAQVCIYEEIIQDNDSTRGLRESKHGFVLPAHGLIRLLVVFVELDYPNIEDDPSPLGTPEWSPSLLPTWADDLFDYEMPMSGQIANGLVTRYFQEASSGSYFVLGDYLLAPDNGGVFLINTTKNGEFSRNAAINVINQKLGNNIVTKNGYNSISDFDKWTKSLVGLPKVNVGNQKWDHVVFIVRNAKTPANMTGFANANGFNNLLLGYSVDTESRSCSYGNIPTIITRHEFAHMILGGNNFHNGGGIEENYWIPQINGWGLLGLYNSPLLAWNAWDRLRLNWKPTINIYNISARNHNNIIEVNGDLDVTNASDAGIYILRDFVSTGDAIRIKLPFIDAVTEYTQYIWIENHQGKSFNNSPFDQWQYQEDNTCVHPLVPGLLMYLQIDKDIRSSNIPGDVFFNCYSDYISPLPRESFAWCLNN